jgi:signal transduction histidine kinase/CheY-like chemotaxis protein
MDTCNFPCGEHFCFDQRLVDAIPAPLFLQDNNGKVLGANVAFRKFFGVNLDPTVAIDYYGLLGPEIAHENREVDVLVLEHGKDETFEGLVRCLGSVVNSVVFHKSAVTGDGDKVIGIVTTLLDKTKQRETELQLRHSQKMEAIGTLAGGIAHDFNNVLTPIIGYAEIMRLLAERKGGEDSDPTPYIAEILTAAKRAKSLVEQILTFSRGSEQQELPQYLHPIVKEVLKLLAVTLPSTIIVRKLIDSDCGMVSIDPNQLHQVLLNLCSNASQAIGDRAGTITVELGKGQADEQGREWIELSVSDTGPGISNDIQERVFEPYFTTKEKEQGTGMGLATVHGIVSKCGGHIELRSEVGQGTRFRLFFPRVMPEQSAGQVGEEQTAAIAGSEQILVVDDEPTILRVTRKILETLGYTVSTCSSAREALSLFAEDPYRFDLLITDLTMPFQTGVELCREIKTIRCAIPVILCSGYGEKMSEEKLKSVGFAAWFTKPVTLQKLAAMVRSVLDDSKAP